MSSSHSCNDPQTTNWVEVGGLLLLVIALYELLSRFHLLNIDPGVQGAVNYLTIFTVGLIAATSSCLAVVGGLLLSVSAKWALTHQRSTRFEKFQPLLLFNAGRIGGYFILGGCVGLLGKSLSLSPKMTGLLTIIIAIVMVILGLNILRILPKKYCTFPLPKAMRTRIQQLSDSRHPVMPVLLGALTFFVPCGFTQSMQLLALGSGGFWSGGLIMMTFALGTLPALLGISVLSSVLEGSAGRFFLKFSGAVVLLLGLSNFNSGIILTGGVDAKELLEHTFIPQSTKLAPENNPYVTIDAQGRQIVALYVTDQGYTPNKFSIQAGRTTWIYAIDQKPLEGCATFMLVPHDNLSVPIRVGGNWVGPITNPVSGSVIRFTCSIGHLTGELDVL